MENKIYQHYQGRLYELLHIAEHEVGGQIMAIYKSLDTNVVYVRDMDKFNDKFTLVDNNT